MRADAMKAASITSRARKGKQGSEVRADLVRADIFQRAMALFEEKGFRGTSMQEIADVCGVTKPAIYYYFSSKHHFLQLLYESVTQQFYEQIDALVASRAGAEAKLCALIEMQVLFSVQNRQFQRLFYQERRELDAPVRATIALCQRKYEAVVLGVIEQGQKEGLFRTTYPRLSMMAILGLLSSVHGWCPHVDMASHEIATGIVDLVLNGMSVRRKRAGGRLGGTSLMGISHLARAIALPARDEEKTRADRPMQRFSRSGKIDKAAPRAGFERARADESND